MMTEMEKIAAQLELFSGKTFLSLQETYDFVNLRLMALHLRAKELEERLDIQGETMDNILDRIEDLESGVTDLPALG
jgi:hypothetical protein